MTKRPVIVVDLLCGAGGFSQGAMSALKKIGVKVKLVGVNHWPRAIETFKAMHPEARVFCQDIATVRPIEAVPEGYVDHLLAAPTCTHHSRARGGKPTSDQQRADGWHVITWLTELRVKRLTVENVPEFMDWGPVDYRTGRPVKSRKGEYFNAWVEAIRGLGFKVEHRVLNAADFGSATTRRRFFLQARSDGKAIRWPEPTHSRDGRGDLFGGARRWKPAREIIDWTIEGKSIFTRKHPLAPKTLRRIYAGVVRFRWPEPFIVVLRQHMAARSIELPLPTLTSGGRHIGLAQAFLVPQRSDSDPSRSTDDPAPSPTTVARIGLVRPFVFGNRENNAPRDPSRSPLPTNTGAHGGGIGLVEPLLVTVAHGDDPGERDPARRRTRSLDEPVPSPTGGGGQFGLVSPFVLSQASGGAPRDVNRPLPTFPTDGAHALIAPYYGAGSGLNCKSVEQPLDTIPTKDRFGLIVPVTHAGGETRTRTVDDPLATITAARRGELAFVTAAMGERDGQLPRVHGLDDPLPVGPTLNGGGLIQPGGSGPHVDILFRMLEWHELAAAMGFARGGKVYSFAGNKTEITRQIGGAVAVDQAEALVRAAFYDIIEKREAA